MDNVDRDTSVRNPPTPETSAEPAPDPKRERARHVLTSWAENERDCAWHLYTTGPFKPEWWCESVEALTRMMQEEHSGNAAHVNAVQLLLRGADVEIVAMLRHLEGISELALARALILCGFIVAIHEDSREKTDRTIEYLLDILAVHTAKSPNEADYDPPRGENGGGSLDFAADVAIVAKQSRFLETENILFGALWFPWYAALVGVTPGEQRWIVTAMYKALTACADALDENRNDLDPFETALSRYLMLGEITDIFAAH